jgi:mandelamide amidase
VPPVLWAGLDKELERVVLQAQRSLQKAGVVFVSEDISNLLELDSAIGMPIAVHEPLADIPAYLQASGIHNVTLQDIVDGISSPDVKSILGAVMNDTFGGVYDEVMAVRRPALQKIYADYFRVHNVDAILFPTTILPAVPIDLIHGSGQVSINDGPLMDTFTAFTRNAAPGSDAGIPGLSIPVGMTAGGLPVGIEIDGPLDSDERLLSLGLAMENIFGRLPPPK